LLVRLISVAKPNQAMPSRAMTVTNVEREAGIH
jgi:hypothetical protein